MEIKDLKIEKLDNFGRGISHYNNKIIFIKNALVDEIVDVCVTKETSKYYEAMVIRYKKVSPKRIKPICPYFDKCGGCNLMQMKYKDQLNFKKEKVNTVLKKYCNLENVVNDVIFDKDLNYRNKVTLKVKNKKIGFYEQKTNTLVEINYCYLLDNKINDLITLINGKANLTNVEEIVIRVSDNDKMIIFKGYNLKKEDFYYLESYVSSIYIFDNEYLNIYGKKYLQENLPELSLSISPDSFLQVNTNCSIKLYDKILKLIKKSENLLDLYCGTGSIGLYVSKVCKNVIGVEINKYATSDANYNKVQNKINNITFYNGKASEVLEKLKTKFDHIIIDPPRKGLDNRTIELLKKLKANNLIYVSCNVNTLARDLNILKTIYEIKEVTPFDMFPNTYHVECVCNLKLKD